MKNPISIEIAKKIPVPQCPECGHWNVRVSRRRRVDFYGVPKIFRCNCGWEKEIVAEDDRY